MFYFREHFTHGLAGKVSDQSPTGYRKIPLGDLHISSKVLSANYKYGIKTEALIYIIVWFSNPLHSGYILI